MYFCTTLLLHYCTWYMYMYMYSVHGRGGLGRRKPDWAPLPLGTLGRDHFTYTGYTPCWKVANKEVAQ